MFQQLQAKLLVLYQPQAIVNNAALTINVVDTQGYDYLTIDVYLGATDTALTVLKCQESDVKSSATALTSGADITGTVFGTDANDTGSTSTLPTASSDNGIYQFAIDLKGRKRYILPLVTIGAGGSTGAFTAVVARLSRAKIGNRTAVQSGLAQRMIP